jgi:hypothetical protein
VAYVDIQEGVMPYSGPEFTNTITQVIKSLQPATCLDVGVGAGKVGAIVKAACPECTLVGIEAHGPYAERFKQQWSCYQKVHIGDALQVSTLMSKNRFDLVVFGDVLEHMWVHEAKAALSYWADRSKAVVAIWPTGYQQDEVEGATSEIHRSRISLRDLYPLDIVRFHKHQRSENQAKCFAVIRGAVPGLPQAGVAY